MGGRRHGWRRRAATTVFLAVLLMGFAVAHSAEDFALSIPEERFDLDTATGAGLLGIALGFQGIVIALAALDHPVGHAGNVIVGGAWLAAGALDHLGELLFEWPYRAGVISKVYEAGLILSALLLVVVSLLALWGWLRAPAAGLEARDEDARAEA